MDIVYVFRETPEHDSAELRYSLRSLKNIEHDKVFIVGEKPSWMTNVKHIPVAQDDTKWRNVARNLTVASETTAISENFILMNDDFYFMKYQAEMPTLHWGTMRNVIGKYEARYAEESPYIADMKQLLKLLTSLGFEEPLSYELHVPMVLNKTNIRTMHNTATGRTYQFRSYYGNCFKVGGSYTDDVKVFLDQKHNEPAFVADPTAYLQAQSLLSVTGGSFDRGLAGAFIKDQFPEKSPYEK